MWPRIKQALLVAAAFIVASCSACPGYAAQPERFWMVVVKARTSDNFSTFPVKFMTEAACLPVAKRIESMGYLKAECVESFGQMVGAL